MICSQSIASFMIACSTRVINCIHHCCWCLLSPASQFSVIQFVLPSISTSPTGSRTCSIPFNHFFSFTFSFSCDYVPGMLILNLLSVLVLSGQCRSHHSRLFLTDLHGLLTYLLAHSLSLSVFRSDSHCDPDFVAGRCSAGYISHFCYCCERESSSNTFYTLFAFRPIKRLFFLLYHFHFDLLNFF